MGSNLNNAPLVRGLGFWTVWAIGVGAVVGDGVFIYMATAIEYGGPASLIGFAFAGLTQMVIMVAMCEIAVGMPSAGAMTVWGTKYLGKFWGLLSGLTFSVGWMVIGGSVSVAMGRFTCYWFPNMDLEFGTVFWAAVFFTFFIVMNIVGAVFMGRAQLFFVVILVGIMIVFGVGGLIKGVNMDNFVPFMPNGIGGVTAGIPIATYAFMGASVLCTAGSECKKPLDLAKALVWASVTFIAVYTIAMFVVIGSVHWTDVNQDVSPFTMAAGIVFGPIGGNIMNVAAWLAAATCVITGNIYTPSRIFYEMGKEGYFPALFARINPKTKTPIAGIIVIWIVGLIGIAIAYFAGAMVLYETLSNQAVIAWITSWIISVIAGMRFRNEMGKERMRKEVGWVQPLYPLIPVLALASCAYVLYLAFYDIWQVLGFAIWMGIYVIYYMNIRGKLKKGLIRDDVAF